MKDRFRVRVWDVKGEEYIYDAQFEPDYDFIVDDAEYIPEQCTGLKDKNGELIYENDVVSLVPEIEKIKYVVRWDEYNAQLFLDALNKRVRIDFNTVDLKLEVVGNINENPELLEATND